jgi:hypothetical protein
LRWNDGMTDDLDDGADGDPPARKASAGKRANPPSRKARADKGGNVGRRSSKRNAGAVRPRHDGFTPAKQRTFFKALKKCGCIRDACRASGISKTTVDRWRGRDEGFDDKVNAALAIASDELDMIAWQRATRGCEEKVYREGQLVSVRVKPSDAILRLLMQGANPEKYGRTGQPPSRKNKALLKRLKREAAREIRAAYEAGNQASLVADGAALLGMMKRRREQERLKAGWTAGPDGRLVVPPGWRMVRAVPLLPPPRASG